MLDPKHEQRSAQRRPILDQFSIFVVVPKKGSYQLDVKNISEEGIFFNLDVEGESPDSLFLQVGNTLDIRFYLNSGLYIPLTVQVARVEQKEKPFRQIGCLFQNKKSENYLAFLDFLHFLDRIVSILRIEA